MLNIRMNYPGLAAVVVVSLAILAQQASAHTRLTVSSAKESASAHGTTTTAVNIPHGCGDNAVIGNVFFLPDTNSAIVQTSTDSFATFETAEGESASNYIKTSPYIRLIKSRDVFEMQELITDSLGNPLGFWAAHGELPPRNWVAQLPLNITSVDINPESCASKVVFVPAIANICKVTSLDEINGQDPDNPNVDFWTAPDVGTVYDAPDWSYPASFTVERDLEKKPLPESCGAGFAVRVVPSAGQLHRDMPVKINGKQVWPLP